MALATSRQDALQLAYDWIGRAFPADCYVSDQHRAILIFQASVFLLMSYETTELRIWRDEYDRLEVVPVSILIDA